MSSSPPSPAAGCPEGWIYLDNCATSFPKPPEVPAEVDRVLRTLGVNPGRSGYDLCVEAGDLVLEARRCLADLFGSPDPERVVFASNATDALNLTIGGLLAPGDHAIACRLDHNASLRPLWHLHEAGLELEHVGFDARGYLDPDDIVRRVRRNTRAVVLSHASNVLGTVQPVAAVGRACRERGIPLVLDVAQTAGLVPVRLDDLGADVLCFTGHKALLGPMGVGGMVVREGVTLRQTRAGGTGVRSVERRHLPEYPYRMEFGTPNLPGIAGLLAGVRWLLGQGMAGLHARELRLWRRLRDGLAGIRGVRLYAQDREEDRLGVLTFNVEGFLAGDVGTLLDVDHGIACRTGLHCAPLVHESLGTARIKGAVRFGLGPFNTEAHVDAAVAAVAAVAALGRARPRTLEP